MSFKLLLALGLTIIFLSCSKSDKKIIYKPQEQVDGYKLYKEGLDAFEDNDYFYASKKFSEAELNFKIVEFAAKSAIMSSYALYGINFYEESLEILNRYLHSSLSELPWADIKTFLFSLICFLISFS